MKTGSNGLSYPFDNRPNPGELIEVGPGIFWVRMPLPISLNHINLWMLEEQDGWTLVDTGMATEDTKALWEEIFSTHLNSKPVKQVIVTHMHFDHLGLAGWLVEKWGATLCMSRTEYLSSRVIINEIKSDPPEATVAFFRAAGVEESILDEFKVRFNNRSDFVSPLPSHYKRLTDNQVLQIGSLQWTVIIVEGHSPEHICLHCKSLNIMIAGDQILPRISPNISVRPDEPRANPLHNFLRSCESLKNRLNKGDSKFSIAKHIIIRSVSLLLIGFFMVNYESANNESLITGTSLWVILMASAVVLIWTDWKRSPINKNISNNPVNPNALKLTAQGYMKITSTSNKTNKIAVKK